jgi:CRISPR-associated protein Cas1
MIRKTVEFTTPGTRLSVAHRQLVIERPDKPKATLPIEDLGVVIVDDVRATYTQAVFMELLEAGATVMVTGRDHLPAGMMLPLDAHHVQTERHLAQVEASEPVKKRAWQSLIQAKIAQQGIVLSHFTGDHGGLAAMALRVKSGDPDNLEAQAAQRYWPRLFGKEFRRDRDADGVNALLNYGYAIVRAAAARAVVASGLIPSLGVFH